MDSAWIGLVGVLTGLSAKAVIDWLAEARTNRRIDKIWRREKVVDAVASLSHEARLLMAANSRLSRAIHSTLNAQQSGNQAVYASCVAAEREVAAEQAPLTGTALAALAQVRVYASESVVSAAEAVWTAIGNSGSLPSVLKIQEFEDRVTNAIDALVAAAKAEAGL